MAILVFRAGWNPAGEPKMHPVCIQFPAEPRLANALWCVLETGAAGRTTRAGSSAVWRMHLDSLLYLVRERLSTVSQGSHGLWMERRELGDLLVVLDDGLRCLAGQSAISGTQQEAVAVFLQEVRRRLPPPRKPASRQVARDRGRAVVAAAAAGA